MVLDSAAHPFLTSVERRLADVLGSESRLAHGAQRLVLAPGAKRARAHVCRSLADVLDVDVGVAVEIAAIVELVHGASLLHDDVVDRSDLRRGLPTVNATDGNAFAVLCGDLALAKALSLAAALPGGFLLLTDTLDVVERMTRAAVFEVEARGRLPESGTGLQVWTEMVQGKTGALFGLCGSLVARAANVDDVTRLAMKRGLESIGLAFQLLDDLADVAGTDAGKPRGQDVRERALNHPLLVAVDRDAAFKSHVDAVWRGGVVADDDVVGICDVALAVGGAVTLDEARAAVSEGAMADAAPLTRDVLPWARALVDKATSLAAMAASAATAPASLSASRRA
jgi:octaprenyl-diphosphate synthase